MAIDVANDNRIVGVRAQIVCKRSKGSGFKNPLFRDNPSFKFLELIEFCEKRYNPHDELDVDQFLHLKFLCVHRECRGKNISGRMIEFTFQFMRRQMIPVAFVFASSHYSQAVFKRLGFELVDELNYEDYKVDGEVVFNLGPIHTKCASFIKWVK